MIKPEQEDQRVLDFYEGKLDLVSYARERALPLDELLDWFEQPSVQKKLRGLQKLHEQQAQCCLNRSRGDAALRLVQLIHEDHDKPDITRRACLDILNVELTSTLTHSLPQHQVTKDWQRAVMQTLYGQGGSFVKREGEQDKD